MDKTKNEESLLGKTKDKLNEVIKENLTIKDLTSEAQTEEGAIQTEGRVTLRSLNRKYVVLYLLMMSKPVNISYMMRRTC